MSASPSPTATHAPAGVAGRPRLRERAAPWIALALVTLAVGTWGALLQRTRGVLPEDAADASGPFPVTLGRARTVGSPQELAFAVQEHAPGEVVALGAEGTSARLGHELDRPELALTLLGVLVYAATCVFVLAPRAALPSARALFACMACAALGVGIGGVYPPRGPGETALLLVYLASMALLPATFFRLTLRFPHVSPFAARHPRLPAVGVAASLAVAAWAGAAWLAYLDAPGPAAWERTRAPMLALDVLLVVGMAAGCASLFLALRRARLGRERAQVKWVLWGIATAVTPYVFLRVLPGLFGAARADSPVPPWVDRVLELAAPAAFAIAVARHRLFDIDVIIRRSVLYTALAVLLAGAAMGVVLLLERALPPGAVPTEAVWLLAGAVPVALFVPLRRGLGRWVDRTLFKIRHVHGRSLLALDAPLARAADAAETARVLRRFVEEALHPRRVVVVVPGRGECVVEGAEAAEGARAVAALEPLGPGNGIALASPGATTTPEIESAAFPAGLAAAGIVLVQPAARQGHVRALLLLGPKASERAYVEEDLALLSAAAARAAISLERLALVQDVAQEALARRALAELDRQKTDFLLRVAHDLRTPLTAVRWTVDNLLDGLSGPLTERQAADLAPVRSAASQLHRMVDNLLAVSRLELGATRLACEAVDLEQVVREAVGATRPLATAKGVAVTLEAAQGLAPVRGRRDALYEIALNLVDNAIKYSPPGGAVAVALAAEDGGAALTVRDHGPGLNGADPAALFDLFRQGAASPHSTAKGFGVGLYVVRSWVETFGGRVSAADAPGGGALFTCRLARWSGSGGNA